jgi:hypothetical protein
VRTIDGRRGLLSADHVVAVVPEHERVVVSSRPVLLELDAPRLEAIDANVDSPAVASWGTTGAALPPPPAPGTLRRAALGFRSRHRPRTLPPSAEAERPIWQMVALLYSGLTLLVALLITTTFVVAYLVTGRAY